MRLRTVDRVGVVVIGAALIACTAVTPSPALTDGPTITPTAAVGMASPQLTPIDTTTWVEFSSERHGYSIEHPADWTTTHASARWGFNAISLPGSPALDELDGGGRIVVAASQPIPPDLDEEAWMKSYADLLLAVDPGCGRPLDEWDPVEIDANEGAMVATCEVIAAVAFEGRGYEFRMLGDLDLDLFEALLGTIRLEPERADDT